MLQSRGPVRLFLALLAGCGTAASPLRSSAGPSTEYSGLMISWTARHGGCLERAWQTRAASAGKPLIKRCCGIGVCVAVLDTEKVGAFGWPNGHLFVTRGLMERLDDAELSAAIAHELGHLLDSGTLQIIDENSHGGDRAIPPQDSRRDADREVRADAAGLQLLLADGIPPRAMLSMLRKVELYGELTSPGKLAFERRLKLLSARVGGDALIYLADDRQR
jgi:hypothetical protein